MIQSRKATNTHIVLYLLLLIDLMYNDGQTFQIVKTTSHTHIRNVWQGLARLWIFALIYISKVFSWFSKMALYLLAVFKTLQNTDWSKWLLRDGCSYHDRSTSMFNTWQKTLWVELLFFYFFYLAVSKQKQAQIEDKGKLSINVTFALFRVFFYLFICFTIKYCRSIEQYMVTIEQMQCFQEKCLDHFQAFRVVFLVCFVFLDFPYFKLCNFVVLWSDLLSRLGIFQMPYVVWKTQQVTGSVSHRRCLYF